jgi:hypothetical protein
MHCLERVPGPRQARVAAARALVLVLVLAGARALAGEALPDLAASDVEVAELAADCQTLVVGGALSATLRNLGEGSAPSGTSVSFFEDRDLDGRFDLAADLVLGRALTSAEIAPGETERVEAAASGRLLFAGNRVHVLVDPEGEVAEEDEDNNTASSADQCRLPGPVSDFRVRLKWSWDASTVGEASPTHLNVMNTPVVVDLDGDALPEIVFAGTAETSGAARLAGSVRALRGTDGSEVFTAASPAVNAAFSLAVGDLDGDGLPEIVGVDAAGMHVVAFESDGSPAWSSSVLSAQLGWGAVAIANLDGEGSPEVIVGNRVFDAGGALRWEGTFGTGSLIVNFPVSYAVDVDLDGALEVLAGDTVYEADGGLLWQSVIPDAWTAIADLDADPEPEIVALTGGTARANLIDHAGDPVWGPLTLPGQGGGAIPLIADLDGDGREEIGIGGRDMYVAYEAGGSVLWDTPVSDVSSGVSGSAAFDFDGDGDFEVVYRDEEKLYILDGVAGGVLFDVPLSSCTWMEYPVIADVDGDGAAEVVCPANNNCNLPNGDDQGIRVYEHEEDQWMPARAVWNQYAYHVTNVGDDATIPLSPATHWLAPGLNGFRKQVPPGGVDPLALPDLTVSFLRVVTAGCPEGVEVLVRVGNGGSGAAPAGVVVLLFDGDPSAGGVLVGTGALAAGLEPGTFEDVSIAAAEPLAGPRELWVVADDDGAGQGVVSECREDNNACAAVLDAGCRPFRRGECNGDGFLDGADAVFLSFFLFLSGDPPACADACDPNDDGREDLADVLHLLNAAFLGAAPPEPPFEECGFDPSPDALGCGDDPRCGA